MPKDNRERDMKIINDYVCGRYLTTQIAAFHKISRQRVAQIAKKYGVVRTRAEANRIATPHKRKRRISMRRYGDITRLERNVGAID